MSRPAHLSALLDSILAAAHDIDHALLLADALGWRLHRMDAPSMSGTWWVMMKGPAVEHVSFRHAWQPEVVHGPVYSNASFRSFYGAIILALLRGVLDMKSAPIEAAELAAKLVPKLKGKAA